MSSCSRSRYQLPGSSHTSLTRARAEGGDPAPVNGEEVRGTSFRRRSAGGYSAIEVDDLLRRVAAELDAGQPAGPLIANATFQSGGKRSYDIDAVDWFLGQLT